MFYIRLVVKKWIPQYGAAAVNLQAMKEKMCHSVNSCLPEKVLLTSKCNSLVLFFRGKHTIMIELHKRKSLDKKKKENNS